MKTFKNILLNPPFTHVVASLELAVPRKDRRWRFASAMTAWLPDAATRACAGTSSSFQHVSSHWSTFSAIHKKINIITDTDRQRDRQAVQHTSTNVKVLATNKHKKHAQGRHTHTHVKHKYTDAETSQTKTTHQRYRRQEGVEHTIFAWMYP